MGLFKRKSDPIQLRERALNAQIAELEARIQRLNSQLPPAPPSRRVAASSTPPLVAAPAPPSPARPAIPTPIPRPTPKPPSVATAPATHPELYNELGVRKFDLAGLVRRCGALFRTPAPSNPHLFKYLAYGGLREPPALRFEKRVARNRFLLLVGAFTIVLWILLSLVRNHQ